MAPTDSLPRGLLGALALAVFAAGAAEMTAIGFQHDLAVQLAVSPAAGGLVVSVYAVAVAVGGPLLTAAVSRLAPARSLVLLLLAFALTQAGAALAPTLGWLLVARVPAGVLMGALFAVSTVAGTRAAPAGREGAALGLLTVGLTASLVAGAPLGSALAGLAGWRTCFWAIGALALVAASAVVLTRRRLGPAAPVDRRAQLAAVRRPAVRHALVRTLLVIPAVFCTYTYLTPLLADVTGLGTAATTGGLLLLGLAAMAGSTLGGRGLDAGHSRWLRLSLLGVTVALVVLGVGAALPVVALVAVTGFGLAAFVVVPVLQGRAIAAAGDAPLVAAGLNISAFNLANTVGAALGGLAISVVGDARAPVWAGAGLAVLALALLPVLDRFAGRGSEGGRAESAASASAVPAVPAVPAVSAVDEDAAASACGTGRCRT